MTIKAFHIICLVLLTAVLAGCPKPILKEEPSAEEEITLPEATPEENPRVAASLQLTDQGRRAVAVLVGARKLDRVAGAVGGLTVRML